MPAVAFVLGRISPATLIFALFVGGPGLSCQTPTESSAAVPGSTRLSPIAIEYQEELAHRLGDTPILRVSETQASRWQYDDFEYQVTVSPTGEIAEAMLKSNPAPDMPSTMMEQAARLVHTIHFKPFERDGRPVWATLQQYVLVLPPEKLPKTHVPFPAYEGKATDRKALLITLERTVCYGTCPAYVLRIHGDGRVEFDGQRFVGATGRQAASISVASVDALVEEFRKADFFRSMGSIATVSRTTLPAWFRFPSADRKSR